MRKVFIILVVICFTGFSCRKIMETDSSHLVPTGEMWKEKNDARSAVFATYGLMRAALANENAWFVYGELRAGDFNSRSRSDLLSVIDNNLNATFPAVEDWKDWRRFYAVIMQANLCLEKLPEVTKNDFRYNEELMSLDIANVRFLRALSYFYLVRIWGDVPLLTSAPSSKFENVEKSAAREVLDFAIAEAKIAADHLPWQYNGNFPEQKGGDYWETSNNNWKGVIATKGGAYALIAHLNAWKGNYLEAEMYLRMVINNASLAGLSIVDITTLTNTAGGVFSGKANDIIFALPFSKDYQESSGTGHIEEWVLAAPFISKKAPDLFIPNETILNIFDEQKDSRFSINDNGTQNSKYFYGFGTSTPIFNKINQLSTTGENPLQNYQSAVVIFRFEELILLHAEALFFLGRHMDAIKRINSIRTQRNLSALPDNYEDIERAILQERHRELLGEGHRWFDLVRFEKVPDHTRFTTSDIQNGALHWPIAQRVLGTNPKLSQNNYWSK